MVADRERHLATRPAELVGDLQSRRRGADDEHSAIGHLRGIAVGDRGQLVDMVWHVGGDRRDVRSAARPGCHDDCPGVPRPVGRLHDVTVLDRADPGDLDAGSDRRVERATVGVEVGSDVPGGHVAVRIVAGVGEAGEPAHPVGGERAE